MLTAVPTGTVLSAPTPSSCSVVGVWALALVVGKACGRGGVVEPTAETDDDATPEVGGALLCCSAGRAGTGGMPAAASELLLPPYLGLYEVLDAA